VWKKGGKIGNKKTCLVTAAATGKTSYFFLSSSTREPFCLWIGKYTQVWGGKPKEAG
jgi:hypothetical protein